MREIGLLAAADARGAHDAAERIGWLMAAELLACGIDMSFAPVVDLDRGIAAVIGDRAFHSDAETVASLTLAFVRGMRRAGMAATAKHFPTHAGAMVDSHQALATDRRGYSQLYDDLIPYRRLIGAGLAAVMVGHVVFPELDERPASLSRWWIVDQLRNELGFGGAVISDDLGMGGVESEGPLADRLQAALAAGCDMALLCNDPEQIPAALARLRGYSDPAAQLRLMRLRAAQHPPAWDELRASPAWRAARESIARLDRPPNLELEG